MKRGKVTNSGISRVTAQVGRSDKLSTGDTDMPVLFGTEKIDLVVLNDLPNLLSILENILEEPEIQSAELMEEIRTTNPEILGKTRLLLPDTPINLIPHEKVKEESNNCHTFIRIDKMTPYVDIILMSGMVF